MVAAAVMQLGRELFLQQLQVRYAAGLTLAERALTSQIQRPVPSPPDAKRTLKPVKAVPTRSVPYTVNFSRGRTGTSFDPSRRMAGLLLDRPKKLLDEENVVRSVPSPIQGRWYAHWAGNKWLQRGIDAEFDERELPDWLIWGYEADQWEALGHGPSGRYVAEQPEGYGEWDNGTTIQTGPELGPG